MPDQPTKIRDVAWSEMFPWLLLMRSVRISLLARVLILGAAGLLATWLGWLAILQLFHYSTDPVVVEWGHSELRQWENAFKTGVPNPNDVNATAQSAGEVFESASNALWQAPISIFLYITRPFIQMFDGRLTFVGFVFLFLCGIWELLVWGLFGGAITRIAALKFTRDEAPGVVSALRHAAAKLPSYSLPPLIAMIGTGVFAIQLVILGFAMRVSVLAFLAALAWPFVILLGLLMAILLLGALAGWPLMWATVSVEGTDAFDALSRSYAYTYHRPWRLLWYVLFAGFLAVVSMFVVKLFATSAVTLGNWGIDWGVDDVTMRHVVSPLTKSDREPATPAIPAISTSKTDELPAQDIATSPAADATVQEPTGILNAARLVIWFWKSLVKILVAGYQAGFLWVSAVGIYLLLRRDIDGVQINEVFVDQTDEYGLPPLADDPATGVPEVVPSAAAVPADARD
ncbi:MAG: hypothetical protein U0805_09990 [Pirellulales bacterium]